MAGMDDTAGMDDRDGPAEADGWDAWTAGPWRPDEQSSGWAASDAPRPPAGPLGRPGPVGPAWGGPYLGFDGSGPPDLPTPPAPAANLAAGAVCFVAMLAAGPLLGLLWAATAPRISVAAVLAGSEAAFDAQGGVDAYFSLIFLVGGLVGGALGFWRGRDAGWPVPLGLALGGLGGSLLGGLVGHAVRGGRVRSQVPSGVGQLAVQLVDFRVRSHGLYVVMPVSALVVLVLLLWISARAGRA